MRIGETMGRPALAALAMALAAGVWMAAKPAAPTAPSPAAAAPQARAAKPATQGKTAGEMFKNLKVLNNIPANQLFPTMHFVAHSLGVRCEFCHVAGDFASDAKPHKQRARQMMRMVEAIDRENFRGFPEVSCYTCHQGSPHPVSAPPLAGISTAAEAKVPAGETAKTIYQKYLNAIGGQAAIASTPALVAEGSVKKMNGQTAPVRASWTAAGQTEWTQGPALQLRALGAQLIPALDLAGRYPHMELGAAVKIDGQLAYPVMAFGPHGMEEVYFDASTGLVRRIETFQRLAIGMQGQGVDYGGYAAVHGVMVPRDIALLGARSRSTIQITSVQAN
ncbi:MAG: c-type cytochrome [Terriglobales bacterium]